MKFSGQSNVSVGQLLACFEGAISPVLLLLPSVTFDRQTEPTEFAKHHRAVRHRRGRARAGILVMVNDIASGKMIAAARAIDEPGRVELLDEIQDVNGVELPPAFVERHPDNDARMIVAALDERAQFAFVNRG